jgi:hypothetical protein
MFKFSRLLLCLVLVVGAVTPTRPLLLAQQSPTTIAADPIIGVWDLNVAKSKYVPGPAPKSQTRIYELHPKGVKTTIKTDSADGTSGTVQYIASYDGIEYPVTGSLTFDAITLNRIDRLTAEAKLTHASKEIGSARRVISEDGKTMTITFEGPAGEGRTVKNVSVYDRSARSDDVAPSETSLAR